MKGERTAPYDERNAIDYRETSRRIADALDEMERDQSIPATQKELARRAKCSRGTLRNRQYPIARLKSIKDKRRLNGLKSGNTILKYRPVEAHIEDKKRLLEQVERSRTEIAIWFDKFQESEKTWSRLLREKEMLLAENKSLKERNEKLEKKLSEIERALSAGKKRKRVLPFPKTAKNRRNGEGSNENSDA